MICDDPFDPNPECEIGQSPTGGFNQLEACQPNTAFLNEYFISSDYTTLLKMALIVIFVFLLYLIF